MMTLLVRRDGALPPKLREIIRAGSTELKEVSADEERDATTLEADRVVVWDAGHIELCLSPGEIARLTWPDDEEKLRLFFQTAG